MSLALHAHLSSGVSLQQRDSRGTPGPTYRLPWGLSARSLSLQPHDLLLSKLEDQTFSSVAGSGCRKRNSMSVKESFPLADITAE